MLSERLSRASAGQSTQPIATRFNPWWDWIAVALGSALTLIGSVALGATFQSSEPWSSPWTYGGGLIALAGVGLVGWNQLVAKRAEHRRARNLTTFNDALAGIHSAVEQLLRSRQDFVAREQFFKSIVDQASHLFSLEGVRVCVYELESADRGKPDDDVYLRLADSGGRGDPPRNEFRSDTPHGLAAIEAAQGNTAVCVHDVRRSAHPVDRPPGAAWSSYFSVPLRGKIGPSRGMLSVDTRRRTRFTEEDTAIATTVAKLIVIGLDELAKSAMETTPEVTDVIRRITQLGGPRQQPRPPAIDSSNPEGGNS